MRYVQYIIACATACTALFIAGDGEEQCVHAIDWNRVEKFKFFYNVLGVLKGISCMFWRFVYQL